MGNGGRSECCTRMVVSLNLPEFIQVRCQAGLKSLFVHIGYLRPACLCKSQTETSWSIFCTIVKRGYTSAIFFPSFLPSFLPSLHAKRCRTTTLLPTSGRTATTRWLSESGSRLYSSSSQLVLGGLYLCLRMRLSLKHGANVGALVQRHVAPSCGSHAKKR